MKWIESHDKTSVRPSDKRQIYKIDIEHRYLGKIAEVEVSFVVPGAILGIDTSLFGWCFTLYTDVLLPNVYGTFDTPDDAKHAAESFISNMLTEMLNALTQE